MPRPHFECIRQRKQLPFDAGDQIRCMAAGKVRSSDASLEQHISADHPLSPSVHKNHVARSMTRCETNLQYRFATPYGLVGTQINAQRRQWIHVDAIHRC